MEGRDLLYFNVWFVYGLIAIYATSCEISLKRILEMHGENSVSLFISTVCET